MPSSRRLPGRRLRGPPLGVGSGGRVPHRQWRDRAGSPPADPRRTRRSGTAARTRRARFAPHATPAIVNGTAGLIVPADVGLRAVVGFTVLGGKVTAIDLITDREKLRRLRVS